MITPNIEGTYHLVRREFPDGTIQNFPAVDGMMTYTKDFRNFSVVWKDERNRFYSETYVARYTLTDKEYAETAEYLIVDDQIGGKGINYDLANTTAKSPVAVAGGHVKFALPQDFEKNLGITVDFGEDKLKATVKDQFIDYWEKVH
jgi:hypothetical protein